MVTQKRSVGRENEKQSVREAERKRKRNINTET